MNLVFLGTPEFAVPSLRALRRGGHRVLAVITRPDSPKGRGRARVSPPVKRTAESLGLPVLQPASLTPSIIPDAAELGIIVAFGKILSKPFLEKPKHGFINLHASLLPEYRGAAPIASALRAGKSVTGVSIMEVSETLDAGDVLLQKACEVDVRDTTGTLGEKLAEMGAGLLLETLEELKEGSLRPRAQDESLASYAPRLRKSDGLLPWSMEARLVDCHVRAMTPWPSAFTFYRGKRFKILRGAPRKLVAGGAAVPGTLLALEGDALLVLCQSGAYAIEKVQPENRKPMTGRELLAGRFTALGETWESSSHEIKT